MDISAWFPALECSATFNHYSVVVFWTVTPLILWLVYFIVAFGRRLYRARISNETDRQSIHSRPSARHSTITRLTLSEGQGGQSWSTLFKEELSIVTTRSLSLLSLFHTIICMKLFEGLQCDKFDSPGAQGGVESFIHMDYSLDCKTRQHFTYSLYAYFMIVVYVVLLPGIMTWQKWKESLDAQVCPSILAVPYNKKWWYFDALEMVRAQSTFYFHRAHDKTNGLLSFPHSG